MSRLIIQPRMDERKLGLLNPFPKQRSAGPSPFGCSNVNPPSNQRRAKALRYETSPAHVVARAVRVDMTGAWILDIQLLWLARWTSIIDWKLIDD